MRALRVVVARDCSIAPWPATAPAAARDTFLYVTSDEGCLKDGAKYRRNGHGHDGKHGLCEDKLVTDTCLVYNRCDQQSHPHVREFEAGSL